MSPAALRGLVALALLAAQAGSPDSDRAERLARRVTSYEARAELILMGPPAVPALLVQASAAEPGTADESAATVRWIVTRWRGDAGARSQLVEQIGDFAIGQAPAARRAFAVDLLADLGGPSAVDRLTVLLDDADLAELAVLALERIAGEAGRTALEGAAVGGPGERRRAAYAALGRRAEPQSIPLLLAAAERGEQAAVEALAGYQDERVVAWLSAAALGAAEPAARERALSTLLRNPAAAGDGELLARLARGAGSDERLAAILGSIRGSEQYHPDLVDFLLASQPAGALEPARLRALVVLGPRLESQVVTPVVRQALAAAPDTALVLRALALCATRCTASAADDVGRLLRADDPLVRHAAASALSAMDGTPAAAVLARAVTEDPTSPEAATLVDALGRRADAASVDALLRLLPEVPETLRRAVLEASLAIAERVDAATARRIWAATLAVTPTPRALTGLASVGGSDAVGTLTAVLAERRGETYEAARDALVELGRSLAASGETTAARRALHAALGAGAPVETDLRRLGERVDLVAHGGRVDAWWHAVETESASCDQGRSPGEPAAALLAALDETPVPVRLWQPWQADHPRALVELPAASADAAGADWLVADLTPRQAGAAELVLRSTLPVTLRLNGEEPGPLPPPAGREEDERRFRAVLGPGANRLILGACRGGEALRLSVQLLDESGRPLKFAIR